MMEQQPASTADATLERSTSQLSTLSTLSAKSARGHSVRAKSRSRKLASHPSSSASSVAASASDKSLTSFPSFSPESPRDDRPATPDTYAGAPATATARKSFGSQAAPSIVESLTSTDTQQQQQQQRNGNGNHDAARDALFEDTPIASGRRHYWQQGIPGALHLASDAQIERLAARHPGGAVALVRQVAGDLAQRDAQMAGLRRRADERERALRRMLRECGGLSNLELETRLRAVEQELRRAQQQQNHHQHDGQTGRSSRDVVDAGGLSEMMSDAMHDDMSYDALGIGGGGGDYYSNSDTLRAGALPMRDADGHNNIANNTGKGTMRAWKDYLWGGGTSRKTSRAASVNGDGPKAAVRSFSTVDRRPPIQEDLFNPPGTDSVQNSSRASSIYSAKGSRKPSTSLASMALQLVVGKANVRDSDPDRGRSNSTGHDGSQNGPTTTRSQAGASANRAVSNHVGPRALMAMRRATPLPVNPTQRTQTQDRWEALGTSPDTDLVTAPDNSGPVEMDTIFSPEGQPPTLTRIYNNYNGSDYLTDRFGFIYDQRRKKRQREAAQVALQIKRGSRAAEMLSGVSSGISPNLLDDNASSIREIGGDGRPETPTSLEETTEQSRPKKWQDYLKIATFPTELLSHTPVAASNLEVLEGSELPKSPGVITSDDRGFIPPTSTTAALNSEPTTKTDEEPSATLVHDEAEPVKLLLEQLSDVHDALQREKSVRWNEFLRKVRAERRREGEAAAAAAAAAAEARYQKAPVMIPEEKLTDGETIGVADLGVKGKVGRAKWNEFRNLVLGGIPVALRPKIWAECSGALFKRIPGYYEDLVSRPEEDDDQAVVSQIEMDINRTLTDNIFFRRGPGVAKLSEILRAYARRNPEVGYCQGMNLITANLLLIMPSTEETFWVLVSIIEQILPRGYYDHSLRASRADQQVLRQYVTAILPRLSQHLDALGVELEALTFQWFLSVFTDCLSAEALFRVWDVVLCSSAGGSSSAAVTDVGGGDGNGGDGGGGQGGTFLFQVALALLKLNEPALLRCEAPAEVYTYIGHQMTNHAISIDGLLQASEGLRRLVRPDEVEAKRARAIASEEQVARERDELNRIRRATATAAAAATQQQKQNQQNQKQKAASAPALVTETSARAVPSPLLGGEDEAASVVSFPALEEDEED
ncbi:rab-GTPase-TBC domain-containing protein [Xylariaceae sp. FL0804]|nr:rab-GTPase-TBC domain-containing protein [Xylariaceae sp. FL0804]